MITWLNSNLPAFTWLIVLLPLFGVAGSFLAESPRRAAQVCMVFTGAAAALAVVLLIQRLNHNGDPYESVITFWCRTCTAGSTASKIDDFHLQVGVLLDGLSAVFLALVTLLGFAVQLHSAGYLRGEYGYRTLQWQSALLTAAASGLVVSSNLFTLLLVAGMGGISAYLVTAHWTERRNVGHAARRVFLAGRGADLAVMLGMAIVYAKFADDIGSRSPALTENIVDPLSFQILATEPWRAAHGEILNTGVRTLVVFGLLMLIVAALRSALVPLHGWVLGTDEAPTPLAGQVLATGVGIGGVYLLMRLFPFYTQAPHLLDVLMVVGAVSALVGAALALFQSDAVRLLIYGGISQMGLVVLTLSAGAFGGAAFLLLLRALVLTAMFLAVANLMTAYRTRDLRDMGGAMGPMPQTSRALLVTALTAAGVLPLSGFWAIRLALSGIINNTAFDGAHLGHLAQALALAAAVVVIFLGAMWPLRLYALACRGQPARRRGFQFERVREVDVRMRWPLLGAAAVGALVGFTALPGVTRTFAHYVIIPGPGTVQEASAAALVLALLLPLAGAGLAWMLWAAVPQRLGATAGGALRGAAEADLGYGQLDDWMTVAVAETTVVTVTRVEERLLDPIYDAAAAGTAQVVVPHRARTRHALALAGGLLAGGVLLGGLALGAGGHLPWVHP